VTTAEIVALAKSTPMTNIPTASAALGIGANLGYDLVARGEFPVRVLRLGRKLLVPTADLLAVLIPYIPDAEPQIGFPEKVVMTVASAASSSEGIAPDATVKLARP
jgi:hypothetical protein